MSKAVKNVEISKVYKKRRQGSQRNRSGGETQTSRADKTQQESANPSRRGTVILETPLFTFVYVPRSHDGGE